MPLKLKSEPDVLAEKEEQAVLNGLKPQETREHPTGSTHKGAGSILRK